MSIYDDLKAFIDNELSPEQTAEVQAAIDRDPVLRQEVEFMKLLSGEIKSAATEPQVKGLSDTVDKVTFSRHVPAWRPALAYAAGGVGLVFLVGLVTFPMFAQPKLAAKKTSEMAAANALQREQSKSATASDAEGAPLSLRGGGGTSTAQSPDINSEAEFRSQPQERPTDPPVSDFSGKVPDRERQLATPAAKQSWKRTESKGSVYSTPDGGRVTPSAAQAATSVRKVVRNADMGVKVKDVDKGVQEVERQVDAMGGFVESTNFTDGEDQSVATMQFQVPEKNFTATIEFLGKLGKVSRKNLNGTDVTGQIANTDGRITSLADEEKNLIAELQRARSTEARLEIRSRLSSVRQQMEGMKAENKALKDLADMSRVTLQLERAGELEQANANDWLGQSTQNAGNVAGFIGRVFGTGFIYILFLAPFWAPIAFAIWWFRRRARAA